MPKMTQKEAEDYATRLIEAKKEGKKWKEEETEAIEQLRTYCRENPDTKVIGELEVYTKKNAPKIIGDRLNAFVGKLKAKFKTVKPKAADIVKAVEENDTAMIGLMNEYGVEIDQAVNYQFKRR